MYQDPSTLKNTDTSRSNPPKVTISHHQTKINPVRLEDPYRQKNPTENTNNDNHLIYAHEEKIKEDSEEE